MKVEIYQVDVDYDSDERNEFSFMHYDWIIKIHPNFNKEWKQYYKKIYDYDIDSNDSNTNILEEVFRKFNRYDGNTDFPDDFKGHSLSVSDIVVLDDNIYFCDIFGWQELN